MLLAVLIVRGISQPNPYVDADHLKQYPYCGTIANTLSGRMVNVNEAETHYPWVILIERRNERKPPNPPEPKLFECMGAILTQRY